jgi:hypothetical protein
VLADASIVHVKLSQLQLRRPRQWGACWLALMLWRELQLDQFWSKRLGVSRKGTRWGGSVRAGCLSLAGAGQRVAAAPRVAPAQCLGRFTGRGWRPFDKLRRPRYTNCIAVMTGC